MTKPTLKSFQKPALAALILLAMAWMPFALSAAGYGYNQPAPVPPAPDLKHESSILYGPPGSTWMVMDVFAPKIHANGKGIVFMASGGFFSGPKLLEAFRPTIQALAAKSGYTLFAVQHGSQPEDVVSGTILSLRAPFGSFA